MLNVPSVFSIEEIGLTSAAASMVSMAVLAAGLFGLFFI